MLVEPTDWKIFKKLVKVSPKSRCKSTLPVTTIMAKLSKGTAELQQKRNKTAQGKIKWGFF